VLDCWLKRNSNCQQCPAIWCQQYEVERCIFVLYREIQTAERDAWRTQRTWQLSSGPRVKTPRNERRLKSTKIHADGSATVAVRDVEEEAKRQKAFKMGTDYWERARKGGRGLAEDWKSFALWQERQKNRPLQKHGQASKHPAQTRMEQMDCKLEGAISS